MGSLVDRTACARCADGDTDDGDDELAEAHARSADDEQLPAADSIDEVDADDGHDGVDDISDDGNDESVANTSLLEERSAVVEDEAGKSRTMLKSETSLTNCDEREGENSLDTSELLPGLHGDTSPGAETVPVRGVPEAVQVRAATDLAFSLQRQLDFDGLSLDFGTVSGQGHETAESTSSGGIAVLV